VAHRAPQGRTAPAQLPHAGSTTPARPTGIVCPHPSRGPTAKHPRLRLILAAATLTTLAHARCLVARSASASPLLISAAQLDKQLNDPAVVLLHVGPKDYYDAGHIRGARYIDMSMLAEDRANCALLLELPGSDDLRGRLERLGIGDKSRVIVVPGADWGSPATRVVCTLQVAGLGGRTQLLDGGMSGWKRAGLPLTREVPSAATPGRLTPTPDRSMVVDHSWIQARLTQPGFHLIDARAPVFYSGPGVKMRDGTQHDAGHIPGAHHLPFNTLFNDLLEFIPKEAMQAAFAEAARRGVQVAGVHLHAADRSVRRGGGVAEGYWNAAGVPARNVMLGPPDATTLASSGLTDCTCQPKTCA
jgi:3-mercaptopyruvate sulfurtransferase SseA